METNSTNRDALAYAAFARLTQFERRILGVAYGLPSLGGAPDGKACSIHMAAAVLKAKPERVNRHHESAIGKLAAILELEPKQVAYWLFRMATLEVIERQRQIKTPQPTEQLTENPIP